MVPKTDPRRRTTDEQLARSAQGGDEAALARLLERYEPKLRRRVRRSLRRDLRRKIAESDVIQEALLVLNRRLPDFEDRGDGSFGAWLTKIVDLKIREVVRHYAGTAKRDVDREVTRGRRRESRAFPGAVPSPSEAAMARESEERVAAAIEALLEDHRQVVRLVHEEELTFEEVGARMGRSGEAARKLYSRAIARVTRALEGDDG